MERCVEMEITLGENVGHLRDGPRLFHHQLLLHQAQWCSGSLWWKARATATGLVGGTSHSSTAIWARGGPRAGPNDR